MKTRLTHRLVAKLWTVRPCGSRRESVRSKRVGVLVGIGFSVLVGCGGSGAATSGDDQDLTTTQAPSANTPLTLQNYLNHPKIKAIRDEVEAIDNGHNDFVFPEEGGGCEASITKWYGNHGRIYQIVEQLGEGGPETRAYYRNGVDLEQPERLLFILRVDPTSVQPTESRIYFDEQGNKMWQVVRQAGGADRLPQGNEVYQADPLRNSPEAWFRTPPGC
jgi:hypothetical protein